MESSVISRLSQSKFINLILIGALVCSILSLILFGVVGIGRLSEFSYDYGILYKAGRDWLNNTNPYLNESDNIFAYPPNFSFFLVPLALLNFGMSKYCMALLNIISILSIVWISCLTIVKNSPDNSRLKCLLLASFIIGNPFTTHNVWMGQTSLVLLASLMGAWHLSHQNRWLLSGILLGISSFKPQLAILLFVWFLLERNWKILVTSLVTFFLMSYYPLLTQGPVEMMRLWIDDGLGSYLTVDVNVLGSQHVVGLASMLNAAGIDVPSLKIVGVVLTAILWVFRKRFNSYDILGILFGISLTFVSGHDYDYICLIPLITSLLIYTKDRSNLWVWLPSLIFLLIVPQRFVRVLSIPVLNHWRTLIVVTLSVLVLLSSLSYLRAEETDEGLVFQGGK
ncbi:hypothetical protein N836_30615 [Leptolyngbya sp. Heron Island J]|uniref:glycosyltransferase family 87 protein n=1 Tax=Leptolyngbya sp. Heron Island J TaxID=1385935 RepID=UPI0003B950B4|nr:glycosyltransferase family 87 protein [Leptolyngbya sp. Heron Island J]ESA38883.1 hypothetical protein N836_30615 [Leptolyngbya sp. Heron Island J]